MPAGAVVPERQRAGLPAEPAGQLGPARMGADPVGFRFQPVRRADGVPTLLTSARLNPAAFGM